MKLVSKERLQKEIESVYKPLALRSGLSALPFTELSDRDFENLVYCLIRTETENNGPVDFDDVALMQGVGERGRDCVLYQNGHVVGAVQCKNLKERMTRPAIIRELIKFLLFSLLDNEIRPKAKDFKYHLYAPGGLTEPAIKLASAFPLEIEVEIKDGRLNEYLISVIADFESFEHLVKNEPLPEICEALRYLDFKAFEGADLNSRLSQTTKVLSAFFQVTLVAESEIVIQTLEQKWNDAGLNLLTDEALISLRKRLGDVSDSLRVGLGTVDLYGYSMGFIKHIGQAGFEELVKSSSALKAFLDSKLINYIASRIAELVYEEITVPFVREDLILPFTANIINQYLLKAALPKIMESGLPARGASQMYPTVGMGPDELLKLTLDLGLTSQIKVSQGDYSQLPDPDPDRDKRLALFKALRAGCEVDMLEQRFWSDHRKIKRTVTSILEDIVAEFSALRTIIIKDSSFLDNPEEAIKVMTVLKGLGN